MVALGLVMIVRDAAAVLPRALASVQGVVDEMVVLDTGSVDATVSVATAAGAKVARCEWSDDFSAARNAALALSSARWCLVLDADEWLANGAAALREAASQRGDYLGLIEVVSSFDDGSSVRHASSWLPRLLPAGVRYEGRVHEQPVSPLPRRRLPVAVGHDGYREAARAQKADRNRRLLERELVDRPEDAYLWYQLGKDHEVNSLYVQAEACYLRALETVPAAAAWRHDLVVRALFTFKNLGAHDRALQLAEREMPRWQESPDFYFAIGDVLLDWAAEEPAKAPSLLPLMEACWERCLVLGERPDFEGAVAGRGSTLAAHNLALLRSHLHGR